MPKKKAPLSDEKYRRHIARAYILVPTAFFAQLVLYGASVIFASVAFGGWSFGLIVSLLMFTFAFWFTHITRRYLLELQFLSVRKRQEEREIARIQHLMQRTVTPVASLNAAEAHTYRSKQLKF